MAMKRAHGVDISQHQGEFNPTHDSLRDVDFAILKVSEAEFLDQGFSQRNFYQSALKVPVRGAYHFFRTKRFKTSVLLSKSSVSADILNGPKRKVLLPNGTFKEVPIGLIRVFDEDGPDWEAQAQFFLDSVKGKDFHFYALDIEFGIDPASHIGFSLNLFTPQDIQNIKLWIERVAEKTGKPVLLYTNQNIYKNELLPKGGEILADIDLWLAGYPDNPNRDKDDPLVRFPVKDGLVKSWRFWQYSENGPGKDFGVTSQSIDQDVFNGSAEILKDWLGLAKNGSAPPATSETAPAVPDTHPGDASGQPIQPVRVPAPTDAFKVEVVARKTVLQLFHLRDEAGKPIMEPHEPRIRLKQGKQLLVSSSRSESSKDKGDGIIHASGKLLFYSVIDHPFNKRKTRGLYVKVKDVETVN